MTLAQTANISVVIPAKNEAVSLETLLPRVRRQLPQAQIIVVNDGSSDTTATVAAAHGATVINHPYCMGNGAAVKSGARAATGEILIFMDADGQHEPEDIPRLLAGLEQGYAMVVGARD